MELEPFNINNTVEDVLKMLSRLIGEDIVTYTGLTSDLWAVRADEGQIVQVLMNLAVNSRDAMPKGGRLTIKTENITIDEEDCRRYGYERPGRFVCLSVNDTGVGIDGESLRHIFEPFFTTKEVGKGTGLGLSVVYGIVKQHGGWTDVYSQPGQGSTFRIYLPAFSGQPEDGKKEMAPLKEFGGAGEHVLLVEDQQEVRELVMTVLRDNGYVVLEAESAEEAAVIFEREKENLKLVFSDVVLPGKSGVQLVEELVSLKPELHVLLSSGYTDERSQWSVIRERGFRFLQKPYTLPDLLGTVREAIRTTEQNSSVNSVSALETA
jgi:CheY-like chemotaxis protein